MQRCTQVDNIFWHQKHMDLCRLGSIGKEIHLDCQEDVEFCIKVGQQWRVSTSQGLGFGQHKPRRWEQEGWLRTWVDSGFIVPLSMVSFNIFANKRGEQSQSSAVCEPCSSVICLVVITLIILTFTTPLKRLHIWRQGQLNPGIKRRINHLQVTSIIISSHLHNGLGLSQWKEEKSCR